MLAIDRTSFTEFGGELIDQHKPTLERIDMKLGRFNQRRNRWIKTCVICEWNLQFGRLDLAYFREKKD